MANDQDLGTGLSGLSSAEKYLEGEGQEKEAAPGDEESQEDQEQSTQEQESQEEANQEGDGTPPKSGVETTNDTPENPSRDEVAGRGGQTVVNTHSGKNEEVEIQCGATSCVFNRQHNCEAEKVHITFNPNKGMRSAATQCDTYQTAPIEEEEE